MHHSTTLRCSSCDRVGLSPVVPTGTSPLVPSAICQSTRSRNAFSSTDPFLNVVTSAVNDPRNLVLAVMVRTLGAVILASGTLPASDPALEDKYRVAGSLKRPK